MNLPERGVSGWLPGAHLPIPVAAAALEGAVPVDREHGSGRGLPLPQEDCPLIFPIYFYKDLLI